ncbi:uncharacterized protein LMH87_007529 [Akanthomyces muscarius]|uniref:Uncharacterized protein n=1 Tax=Akanthomyces muscarius TaxID=2231603 RepID=A0A9W8QJT0_AKAMU|nr:uncharacterized protein LMH87_007529 [Akanthomyces muscarius]KAJ4159588.1 hypothetical protein LMH87_007529 [Akanthomyces muscarius]
MDGAETGTVRSDSQPLGVKIRLQYDKFSDAASSYGRSISAFLLVKGWNARYVFMLIGLAMLSRAFVAAIMAARTGSIENALTAGIYACGLGGLDGHGELHGSRGCFDALFGGEARAISGRNMMVQHSTSNNGTVARVSRPLPLPRLVL